MKLKKSVRKIMVYAFIMATMSSSVSHAYDFTVPSPGSNKKMLVVKPQLADSNNYEQQGLGEIKIDKISFPRYLRYKNGGSTYVSDYPDNTGLTIKTSALGYIHYRPNIKDKETLLIADKDLGNIGSEYLDYAGDLVWNYGRVVRGVASGLGELVGAIDGMRNFKPSQVKPNTKYVMNKWPAWPASDASSPKYSPDIVPPNSKASAYGSDILRTKFLEQSSGTNKKYAYNNKYRNEATRTIGNTVSEVKGEWRYIGANAEGGWISNPVFVQEGMGSTSADVITPMDKSWNELTEAQKSKYNDPNLTGDDKIVRDRTMKKFINEIFPRKDDVALTEETALKYFGIGIPYGNNVSAVLQAYYGGTGTIDATLLAEGAIDVEVSSLKIKNDKGQQIYSASQNTTSNGVSTGDIVVDNAVYTKAVTLSQMNITETASESGKVLQTLSTDKIVEVIEKGESWSKVRYEGITGYTANSKIKILTQTGSPTANIFIRDGANWSNAKVALVPKGAKMHIVRRGSSWSAVEYNNVFGYVPNEYYELDVKTLSREAKSTNKLKLQPGKRYYMEVTLKNRAKGHIVYNPTVNILLDSKPNDGNDFISKPTSSDAYGVYVKENLGSDGSPTLKKDLAGIVSSVDNKGWFSVDGHRIIENADKSQKVVPTKNTNSVIGSLGSTTISLSFFIDGANNETEMYNRFATEDPNAVQMRFAANLNDKHQISDNLWYMGGIDNVDTSIDDLYDTNNTIATNGWSAAQDLSISGKNDYILKDSKGNTVTGEIKKGENYTLRVKVYNGSKIWGTSIAPKVNYVIMDAATGKEITKDTAQAVNALGKSTDTTVASTYIDIPVRIDSDVNVGDINISIELSEEHNANYDDWYRGNNRFALKLGVISPVDLVIKESMGNIVGDNLPEEIVVFSGETVNIMSEISSNVNYGVGPVKIKFTRSPANEVVEKKVSALDMSNTQEVAYTFRAPTISPGASDVVYNVTAEINPEGADRINEVNYSNNKITFKVRVTGDISKYGCTSIIKNDLDDKNRPSGLAKGKTEKYIDSQFTSYVPTVTVKRRDKVSGSYGSWYDYPIQLKSAQLKLSSKETHKIESVLFKSKFTTDRYAEKIDRDKIDAEGFVDIMKYPNYAKVKAGYGFEIKVNTLYKTDIKESYIQGISKGMDTKLSTGKTVYEEVLSRVNILNSNDHCELKTDKSTMNVVFTPNPETITMNAKDEVLCMMMPNGKEIYTSIATSKKLIERMPRESTDRNNVYNNDIGVEFNYQFTNRNSGVGVDSRKYYIDENTSNTTSTNRYYMRLATNKLGAGGLTHAITDGVYDMRDLEIIVYGGRDEDLKDTSN